MSHLSLSLINRLDQTQSVVFQTLNAVFPNDLSFKIIFSFYWYLFSGL